MSEDDRRRWNQRFADSSPDFTPAEWLVRHASLLEPRHATARALDLACGSGRNALYLASLGYEVDAWDISDVALGLLHAKTESLPIARVNPRQVDLEAQGSLQANTYDLILDFNYLQRSLFDEMRLAVRPGGLLVIHVLMRRSTNDDRNPAHLLAPGELRSTFEDLQVIEYEENPEQGWAALIARTWR